MSAKEQIIDRISNLNLVPQPLPHLPPPRARTEATLGRFCENLLLAGGEWITEQAVGDWAAYLQQHYATEAIRITSMKELEQPGIQYLGPGQAGLGLQEVGVAIVKGELGVAENGAIWVTEATLSARVLPFITQHLIIVLEDDRLVETMHEAYDIIEVDQTGFGVFIAGPSKTADIEQSLVKGAQGARTELVVLRKLRPRENQ
jgi:L-lactate dehydrogenase complex protein LldG